MSGNGPEDEFYYKLTVNLPVKPSCDKHGKVKGNSVTWEFGKEAMEIYRDSKIGTKLLWASIKADAVKTDLSPKLFVAKQKSSRRKREVSYLQEFYCNIDLLKENDSLNGRFSGYVPTCDLALPFSYEDIKVTKFILDGEEKEFKLESQEAGVFAGTDRWGRDVPGLPVNLKFTGTDPWVQNVNLLEIQLQTSKPAKTISHSIKVDDVNELPIASKFNGPLPSAAAISGPSPSAAAIMDVELGSHTAAYPLPSIEVVTDIDPANIMGCYLDTNFGFRYKSSEPRWSKVRSGWNKELEALEKYFTGSGKLRKCNLVFPNIPNDPFTLVFEVITEKTASTETLKLEDVYVGPK